jgi:hypothetical protein
LLHADKRDLSTQLLGRSRRVLIEKVELAFADNTSYAALSYPLTTQSACTRCCGLSYLFYLFYFAKPLLHLSRYVLSDASFGRQKRYPAAKLKD